jgi:hypothetical protein
MSLLHLSQKWSDLKQCCNLSVVRPAGQHLVQPVNHVLNINYSYVITIINNYTKPLNLNHKKKPQQAHVKYGSSRFFFSLRLKR